MNESMNVVILAAGLGTRMKSRMAKVLHRAGGMTLVEHVVETARSIAPADRITVVVGHQAERVKETLAPYGVRFAIQSEQKGTGHAVRIAEDAIQKDGHLMVLYGDAPLITAATLKTLVDTQLASGAGATVLTTVVDDPTGYGRIVSDADGWISAITEQKAATPEQLKIREINSGIYCFRSDLLWKHIGEIGTNNPAGEYYLTDIVEILRMNGHKAGRSVLERPDELLGINTRVELAIVDRIFRDRCTRRWMLAGVTIEKPETVTIDSKAEIGPDTIIEPFARILGRSRIGAECRIGSCSIVDNAQLGDGVDVGAFTMIAKSTVGAGSHIGPYARLRIDNHVEAGSHIGNFVELKKTNFGAGAKAMHLAYLGDSTIGKKVNIGAGTITCNYDGVHKHPTQIGDGAFVGSNSTLVAPVSVGEHSYIGAGSVVTDQVPAKALAIGRGRQVNKEGWVEKRKNLKT